MITTRSCGILLHPTSLPGPYGIGDLGEQAYRFADKLLDAGARMWQVLPLGPTGYGDSPYQSFSAFAGNPLLISPEKLVEAGVLGADDLKSAPAFPKDRVDYGALIPWKTALLRRAYENFRQRASDDGLAAFDSFCHEMAHWLDDYALFSALKTGHRDAVWTKWERGVAMRDGQLVHMVQQELEGDIAAVKFVQYQFFKQWWELRHYCNERGLLLVGDMPIYCAHDSADVWANRDKFQLDDEGYPTVMAGVPPDYFSDTGQLWGNPIYRWDAMANDGFGWWISRLKTQLRLVDIIRIDHFRGFEGYWEVPAGEETAVNGRWVDGPRDGLFEAFRSGVGHDLPIIAENLGVITEDVEALRRRFNLPGMAVFQFGFGHDAASSGLPPFRFTQDTVAYSGTHDNDTIVGWWNHVGKTDKPVRDYIRAYYDTNGREFNWLVIRALMESVANMAIFPVQDIAGLGPEGRMNRPGNAQGNWAWRMGENDLNGKLIKRFRGLAELFGRTTPKG